MSLIVCCVSIGEWLERVFVNDAFVEDESVHLGTCDDFEMFGGRVSVEEVGIDNRHVTSFVKGLFEFIEEVLFYDLVVELLGPTDIEGEASDFASLFSRSILPPLERRWLWRVRLDQKKIHTDDVTSQRSVWCLWLVVICARKFKTTNQRCTRIALKLRHQLAKYQLKEPFES